MQMLLANPKYTVIKPQASITAANAYLFERQLTTVLKENTHSKLLIDLEQVEFLDSAGLMALISSCKLAKNLGAPFSICSMSPSVRIIIELTQLDHIFEILESQPQDIETL